MKLKPFVLSLSKYERLKSTVLDAIHPSQVEEQGMTSIGVNILTVPEAIKLLNMEEGHFSDKQITNKEGREICFIGSENRMKRIFQRMMATNLIELVPDTTRYNAAYRLFLKENSIS